MVCARRDYRRVTPIPNSSSSEADITPPIQAPKIRDYTTKEKLKVIAGTARLGPKPSLPVCGSTALDYAVVSDLFGRFIVANRCKRQ